MHGAYDLYGVQWSIQKENMWATWAKFFVPFSIDVPLDMDNWTHIFLECVE